MQLTYFGHSCFKATINGSTIIFDPFIRGNELAKEVAFEQLTADYILVTHGHFDHVGDLVDLAKQTNATVICNWEIHVWLNKQGITQTVPLNIGGKFTFNFGTVHMVAAVHSSSFEDGSYAGTACGFVIETNEKSMYYAGDTGLTLDMKILAEKFNLSVALLPVGDQFTMGYKDAALAAQWINCKHIIGMHFDTFDLIKINHAEAITHFNKQGLTLLLPTILENISI